MKIALVHIPPVYEMNRSAGAFLNQLKRELDEEWDTGVHKVDFKTKKKFKRKMLNRASNYSKLVPRPQAA